MEVTISQFRRNLFQLVEKTAEGEPLTVIHRGHRFSIVPQVPPRAGLDDLTPLQIVNPRGPGLDDPSWKEDMIREWETDWADL